MPISRKGRQPHLLLPGGGLSGELHALRQDAATAVEALEGGGGIVAPTIKTGQTYEVADTDHNKVYLCTEGAGITVTVPDDVSPGLTVSFIHRGLSLSFVGSGDMVMTPATGFLPESGARGAVLTIYVESGTVCNVSGILAADT